MRFPSLFALLLAANSAPIFGAELVGQSTPGKPDAGDAQLAQAASAAKATQAIEYTLKNKGIYKIPCSSEVSTTIYFEGKVFGFSGLHFYMLGSPNPPLPELQSWIYEYYEDPEVNYITLAPSPESADHPRRNLNVIFKDMVIALEPEIIADDRQASRIVYFRNPSDEPDGRAPEGKRGAGRLQAARDADEKAASVNPASPEKERDAIALKAEERAHLVERVQRTPAVKQHGLSDSVIIGFLRKFQLLTAREDLEIADIEVSDKARPGAQIPGMRSGILKVFKSKTQDIMGVYFFIKNETKDTPIRLVGNEPALLRAGEKVYSPVLVDPVPFSVPPGEESVGFALYNTRDSATLNIHETPMELSLKLDLGAPVAPKGGAAPAVNPSPSKEAK